MTQRKSKLILAAATGLFVLAASSTASASFSIAPFTLQAKSKIYTFFYPTVSGYTFLGSKDYNPDAVTTSTNFPNGPHTTMSRLDTVEPSRPAGSEPSGSPKEPPPQPGKPRHMPQTTIRNASQRSFDSPDMFPA